MGSPSSHLDDGELGRLIKGGEGARVEFKEALEGSASQRIREAVCAFANDLPGFGLPGIAVVGLKSDGSHSGLAVTDELLSALLDMRSDGNIVPPPSLQVEKRLWKNREIAVVVVQPSDSPPVRFKGAIQVRIGPRRDVATAQDERILNERRRYGSQPFDIAPVPGTDATAIARWRFEGEYLPNAVDPQHLQANERSFRQRLAATKMIASTEDERATILGLLVAGNRPRDFIPGAYVQFLRIAGRDLSDEVVDEEAIGGTISEMLQRVDGKLRAHNRRRIDITSGNGEIRTEAYPMAALQQLVQNAHMHRDYESTNAPIRVSWFDDRIEILSLGGPFGSVTAENFGDPGVTDYRNPNLAEAMKVLGHVQRFGIGIPTARRLLREAGHPVPVFGVERTHLLATVPASSRTAEMLR